MSKRATISFDEAPQRPLKRHEGERIITEKDLSFLYDLLSALCSGSQLPGELPTDVRDVRRVQNSWIEGRKNEAKNTVGTKLDEVCSITSFPKISYQVLASIGSLVPDLFAEKDLLNTRLIRLMSPMSIAKYKALEYAPVLLAASLIFVGLKSTQGDFNILLDYYISDNLSHRFWCDASCLKLLTERLNVLMGFKKVTEDENALVLEEEVVEEMGASFQTQQNTVLPQITREIISAKKANLKPKSIIKTCTTFAFFPSVRRISASYLNEWLLNTDYTKHTKELVHSIAQNIKSNVSSEDLDVIDFLINIYPRNFFPHVSESICSIISSNKQIATRAFKTLIKSEFKQTKGSVFSRLLNTCVKTIGNSVEIVLAESICEIVSDSTENELSSEVLKHTKRITKMMDTSFDYALFSQNLIGFAINASVSNKESFFSRIISLIEYITILFIVSKNLSIDFQTLISSQKAVKVNSVIKKIAVLSNFLQNNQQRLLFFLHNSFLNNEGHTTLNFDVVAKFLSLIFWFDVSPTVINECQVDSTEAKAIEILKIQNQHYVPIPLNSDSIFRILFLYASFESSGAAKTFFLNLLLKIIIRAALVRKMRIEFESKVKTENEDQMKNLYLDPKFANNVFDMITSIGKSNKSDELLFVEFFWDSLLAIVILTSFNLSSLGSLIWENLSIRFLIECIVRGKYTFPCCFENDQNELILQSTAVSENEERARISEILGGSNENCAFVLFNNKLHRPPNDFIFRFKDISESLGLQKVFCASRDPDFLFAILPKTKIPNWFFSFFPNLIKSDTNLIYDSPNFILVDLLFYGFTNDLQIQNQTAQKNNQICKDFINYKLESLIPFLNSTVINHTEKIPSLINVSTASLKIVRGKKEADSETENEESTKQVLAVYLPVITQELRNRIKSSKERIIVEEEEKNKENDQENLILSLLKDKITKNPKERNAMRTILNALYSENDPESLNYAVNESVKYKTCVFLNSYLENANKDQMFIVDFVKSLLFVETEWNVIAEYLSFLCDFSHSHRTSLNCLNDIMEKNSFLFRVLLKNSEFALYCFNFFLTSMQSEEFVQTQSEFELPKEVYLGILRLFSYTIPPSFLTSKAFSDVYMILLSVLVFKDESQNKYSLRFESNSSQITSLFFDTFKGNCESLMRSILSSLSLPFFALFNHSIPHNRHAISALKWFCESQYQIFRNMFKDYDINYTLDGNDVDVEDDEKMKRNIFSTIQELSITLEQMGHTFENDFSVFLNTSNIVVQTQYAFIEEILLKTRPSISGFVTSNSSFGSGNFLIDQTPKNEHCFSPFGNSANPNTFSPFTPTSFSRKDGLSESNSHLKEEKIEIEIESVADTILIENSVVEKMDIEETITDFESLEKHLVGILNTKIDNEAKTSFSLLFSSSLLFNPQIASRFLNRFLEVLSQRRFKAFSLSRYQIDIFALCAFCVSVCNKFLKNNNENLSACAEDCSCDRKSITETIKNLIFKLFEIYSSLSLESFFLFSLLNPYEFFDAKNYQLEIGKSSQESIEKEINDIFKFPIFIVFAEIFLSKVPSDLSKVANKTLIKSANSVQKTAIHSLLVVHSSNDSLYSLQFNIWENLRNIIRKNFLKFDSPQSSEIILSTLRLIHSCIFHPSINASHYSFNGRKSDYSLSRIVYDFNIDIILKLFSGLVFVSNSENVSRKELKRFTEMLFGIVSVQSDDRILRRIVENLCKSFEISSQARSFVSNLIQICCSQFPFVALKSFPKEVLFSEVKKTDSKIDLIIRRLFAQLIASDSVSVSSNSSFLFSMHALIQIALTFPTSIINSLNSLNSILFGNIDLTMSTISRYMEVVIRVLNALSFSARDFEYGFFLKSFKRIYLSIFPSKGSEISSMGWEILRLLLLYFPDLRPFVEVFLHNRKIKVATDDSHSLMQNKKIYDLVIDANEMQNNTNEILDQILDSIRSMTISEPNTRNVLLFSLKVYSRGDKFVREKAIQIIRFCIDYNPTFVGSHVFPTFVQVFKTGFASKEMPNHSSHAVIKELIEIIHTFSGHFFLYTREVLLLLSLFPSNGKRVLNDFLKHQLSISVENHK